MWGLGGEPFIGCLNVKVHVCINNQTVAKAKQMCTPISLPVSGGENAPPYCYSVLDGIFRITGEEQVCSFSLVQGETAVCQDTLSAERPLMELGLL